MFTFLQSINIIVILFLLGYWIGVFLILYHLIRFGLGTHPRRIALLMLVGSLILTVLAIMLLFTLII